MVAVVVRSQPKSSRGETAAGVRDHRRRGESATELSASTAAVAVCRSRGGQTVSEVPACRASLAAKDSGGNARNGSKESSAVDQSASSRVQTRLSSCPHHHTRSHDITNPLETLSTMLSLRLWLSASLIVSRCHSMLRGLLRAS